HQPRAARLRDWAEEGARPRDRASVGTNREGDTRRPGSEVPSRSRQLADTETRGPAGPSPCPGRRCPHGAGGKGGYDGAREGTPSPLRRAQLESPNRSWRVASGARGRAGDGERRLDVRQSRSEQDARRGSRALEALSAGS